MLICVIGNSGSGKDTLVDSVMENSNKGVKKLKLVTDRPQRPNETDDRYIFATKYEFDKLLNDNKFVEFRSFKVANGDTWKYGTLQSEFNNAIDADTAYIATCTPMQFTAYYNSLDESKLWRLHPIVLTMISPKARLQRMLQRIDDNYDSVKEVCRRFSDDKDAIDESKLLPKYCFPNDTEADLVRNTDLILQLAREINRHTRHYSDYLDMHSRTIKDTKLLAGFYREDKYNKEDK